MQTEDRSGAGEILKDGAFVRRGGAGRDIGEHLWLHVSEAEGPALVAVIDVEAAPVEAGFSGQRARREVSSHSGSKSKGSGCFLRVRRRSTTTGR